MTDHPTLAELRALLCGGLSEERTHAVVSHLLFRCKSCLALLNPEATASLQSSMPHDEGTSYDVIIDKVFDKIVEINARLREERARVPEALALLERDGLDGLVDGPDHLRGLPRLQALLEKIRALRHEDPKRSVDLARWATVTAASLDPAIYGVQQVADFLCQAWAELGNTLRISDNLEEAGKAFGQAAEYFQQGTQNDQIQAHLFDLQASFYGDRRQFPLAIAALDVVHAIHCRSEDAHLAGRALISKGVYTGYSGSPHEAVRLTREGKALIDPELDPSLAFIAEHNLAWWLMESGDLRGARIAIASALWSQQEAGGSLGLIKSRWLEARIHAGLGDLSRAERDFRKVSRDFADVGQHFRAAIVSLDLVAVLLRRGKAHEAWKLGKEAAEVFSSLGIQREVLGAVFLLREACKLRQASAEFFENLADYMRKAERDPDHRFNP